MDVAPSTSGPSGGEEATSGQAEKNSGSFSMTLMINRETNKVLFADCDIEAVSGMTRILEMPVGSIYPIFERGEPCSMHRLRESVASLGADLRSNPQRRYYECAVCTGSPHRSVICGAFCALCTRPMNSPVALSGAEKRKSEFRFLIMDDLSVEYCFFSVSGVAKLSRLKIKDLSVLEERVVQVGLKEGLDILLASMSSSTVLSDVFLEKKLEPEPEPEFEPGPKSSRKKRSLTKKEEPESARRSLRKSK